MRKWPNTIYEKNILIMMALVVSRIPSLVRIPSSSPSSALRIPQIDRGVSRGLLNSMLSDNIKSARVKGSWGWGALSIYNCFLTHWPNFAVPVSEP